MDSSDYKLQVFPVHYILCSAAENVPNDLKIMWNFVEDMVE